MIVLGQTKDGWVWVNVPDPAPAPDTDIQVIRKDIEKIKLKFDIM